MNREQPLQQVVWELKLWRYQKKTGEMLWDAGVDWQRFFGYDSKAQATNAKPDKWDYIKPKNFCTPRKQSAELRGNLQNERQYLLTIHLTRG